MHHLNIYRFRERAAVSGPGQTAYMTAEEARRMARALYKVARSIDDESFTESTVGTVDVDVTLGS